MKNFQLFSGSQNRKIRLVSAGFDVYALWVSICFQSGIHFPERK